MLREAIPIYVQMIDAVGKTTNLIDFNGSDEKRHSGLLFGISHCHMANLVRLLAIEETPSTWISAYSLSRVVADTAMRSVYLACCADRPNYDSAFKRYKASETSPFGPFEQMIAQIRKSLAQSERYNFFPESTSFSKETIGATILADWAYLNDATHGGAKTAAVYEAALRTGKPPDKVSLVVLRRTFHMLLQAACVLLVWHGLQEKAEFLVVAVLEGMEIIRPVDE